MWKHLIYLLFYLCVAESKDAITFNNNDETPKMYNSISKCIQIISKFDSNYRPTVAIDTQNIQDQEKVKVLIEQVVNELQEQYTPMVIITDEADRHLLDSIFISEDTIFGKIYILNGLIIIFLATCNDISFDIFNDGIIEVKHLIIIFGSINNCTNNLEDIRYLVGKHDVTFILIDDINGRSQMFTFIPKVHGATCKVDVDKLIHINTCVNGTLENKEVFPSKKPTNLNKCPFRVGMSTLYPFSVIKDKELLQTYDHINETLGSDMTLMQIVANYFNATLDLYYIYRKEENPFGDYDFLKFLLNGSLDVCAGGLYRIYGDVVDYSGIYARQAVVWIYVADRVERSWENLIEKVGGLYIFIIFYIIYSVIWYLVCVFDKDAVSFKNTLLYGWGALVGATSLQEARSIKQRILNLGYLVMSIHLSAYISVQLYSFLTIREPPEMLNTNDDIMNSGRVPYLKTSTKYFVDDKRYKNFANTSEECVSFIDCAEKTLEHNGLTVVLQGNFYHFQSATSINGEARILRATENVLTVYNEMLIRKDSPLVIKFRRLVQSLFEAGITQRLYNEAIGILVMAKADTANSNTVTNSYSCQAGCTITFMQFAGVFYVWILGCAIACIVFVVELCMKRERHLIFVH